jgi:hypothetical protein
MHWPLGTRWLAALATQGRRRRHAPEDDPAGMGTAFGLDATTMLNSELADDIAARRTAPGTLGPAPTRLESRLHRRSTF